MTKVEFSEFKFKKGQYVTLISEPGGVLESVDFSDNTVMIVGKNRWFHANEIESIK